MRGGGAGLTRVPHAAAEWERKKRGNELSYLVCDGFIDCTNLLVVPLNCVD